MLRNQAICTSTRLSKLRPVTRVTDAINTGVFPGKMCSDRRKNHGCGRKETEDTSSAMFGVGTAADLVRSRTQERGIPQRRISVRNLNFSPSFCTVKI